ncbi:ATP-binding protein [Sphingomonas qomolangmaensis]|uniref:histidine kinase n=1 Tax=Sphingomonas qomolangmaensis TaxID=2918765 RepID=A0ABY5LA26_9SPHN|nr:ATP-binding protein [Sphingomonas qomolangmaensis]UUL83001.1 ATP-binding protein [Sphingomonas qomolangmaensis]
MTGKLRWMALLLLLPAFAANARAQPSNSLASDIEIAKGLMLRDPAGVFNASRDIEQRIVGSEKTPEAILGLATVRWLGAEALVRLGRADNAESLALNAGRIARRLRDAQLYGDTLTTLGGIHAARSDAARALQAYQGAHEAFRQAGYPRGQAIALQNIANLYVDGGDHRTAERYFNQSEEVYDGDDRLSLTLYNNRGAGLRDMRRYAESAREYRRALTLAARQDSPFLQARILTNLAQVYLEAGDVAQANSVIQQAWNLTIGSPEAEAWQPYVQAFAARAAFQAGDLARAKSLIETSFVGIDPATTMASRRDAHVTAYEIYRKLGDSAKALDHLEALRRLTDEQSKLAASTNTALMAARFDFANQELRIARLKADELRTSIEIERARVRSQQTLFASGAAAALVILALLSFGIFTLRRSRNQVRAANTALSTTNVALEKALAAKTEFLATTSHEIRTPLNGILGMTQVMLADRALPGPQRERVNIVHGAGLAMRALVDDILDVAKMETGNLTVAPEPADLRQTLHEVARMWAEPVRAKGLGFTLDIDAAPHWIETDAGRLRQMLFNLLSNAIKFTAQGSVGLSAHKSDDGTRLILVVRDSGIGIPPEKHADIFESFRQMDTTTTRQYGGTGLGLTICRNLAQALGGDIAVSSTAGQGATFTVDLPLVEVAAPALAVGGGKGGLLIVDGNPIARAMLRTLLAPRAGTVHFADSAAAAASAITGAAPECVLVDDSILRAQGGEAALPTIAKAAHDAGARCAVLWRDPGDDDRAALIAAGADLVIAKPIAGVALAAQLFAASGPDQPLTGVVSRAA